MTKDENNLFHANYKYMWNKLSTTYYHVKTGTPKASHIQGGAYLPAYSICSKCFKTDYEPSIGTVDSIVQFYNQNLSPQINTYQFLHEKLETLNEKLTSTFSLFCSTLGTGGWKLVLQSFIL